MKKTIILLLTILFTIQGFAQTNQKISKPTVNRNVELMSIVFRMAGAREFSAQNFKLYTNRIEKHFSPYLEHELIKFAKIIRQEKGVGYDAVMVMAANLDENLDRLNNLTDYSFENRWSKEYADKFVVLLKQFYKDAKCEQFFKENEELYTEAGKRLTSVYNNLNIDWYSKFYGQEPNEQFIIYSGLGNGGGNYGAALNFENGDRHVFAIMGAWTTDSLGMITYPPQNYLSTMIHEFCHSFVNRLNDKYEAELKESGEQVFEVVKSSMAQQAYGGWKTVLNEALVRASVIKYMIDNKFDEAAIEQEKQMQTNRDFLWVRELVGELEKYDSQRDKYPTLESYMSELVKAYKAYPEIVKKKEETKPYVTTIKEFQNGDSLVNADIKTITINFDQPLSGRGMAMLIGKKGKNAFPKIVGKPSYTNDNKSFEIGVELEKGKEYQFIMGGIGFKTLDGRGIRNYEVNFKTAE